MVKVLWKETAFPRWRATDSLWNRYVVVKVIKNKVRKRPCTQQYITYTIDLVNKKTPSLTVVLKAKMLPN